MERQAKKTREKTRRYRAREETKESITPPSDNRFPKLQCSSSRENKDRNKIKHQPYSMAPSRMIDSSSNKPYEEYRQSKYDQRMRPIIKPRSPREEDNDYKEYQIAGCVPWLDWETG